MWCINASWKTRGGNEKHIKYVKNHVNFTKTGEEKFWKVERGNHNFREIGGKCIEISKLKICGRWLKKVIRNFSKWKSKKNLEQVKLGKFSTESEDFFGNRGNLKQREMYHCLSVDGRPWPKLKSLFKVYRYTLLYCCIHCILHSLPYISRLRSGRVSGHHLLHGRHSLGRNEAAGACMRNPGNSSAVYAP